MSAHAPDMQKLQPPFVFLGATPLGVAPKGQSRAYINVFNYHQHYRKAMELMGWAPLNIADSEIGANRKHRANRFMTVIQYCMDLAQHFMEVRRLLRSDGTAIYVIGRESTVRGVAFRNGELLYQTAIEASGMKLVRWQERKFTSRFGETIYEDLLTLKTCQEPVNHAVDVARAIGVRALKSAALISLGNTSTDINQAIEKAERIKSSPLVNVHN